MLLDHDGASARPAVRPADDTEGTINRSVFDKCPETGMDLSFITHKVTGESVRMRRERNVWTIDAFVNEDSDFTRPE